MSMAWVRFGMGLYKVFFMGVLCVWHGVRLQGMKYPKTGDRGVFEVGRAEGS